MKDMAMPVVYFTGLGPETHGDEPLDRLSAVVELFQEKHGYGYSVEIRVWIPRRNVPLSELKKDAIAEARQFLEAGLKVL